MYDTFINYNPAKGDTRCITSMWCCVETNFERGGTKIEMCKESISDRQIKKGSRSTSLLADAIPGNCHKFRQEDSVY